MIDLSNNVYVARYDHEYGTDVRVFRTETGAYGWRTEIAVEWWENEFPDDPKPADDVIGETYFARTEESGSEWFSVEAVELES